MSQTALAAELALARERLRGDCTAVAEGRLAFSWFAYLLSSLLFGLLHADWIAGIAAGLVFGWVRYRSDSIGDAIVAHASANAFLTGYIVVTGHWSLW